MPKPWAGGISASSAGRWILCAPPTVRAKAVDHRAAIHEPRPQPLAHRCASGGCVVTTPRAEADLIVTEHGIAELRGRTLAERGRALIQVADPVFRAELARAGERLV